MRKKLNLTAKIFICLILGAITGIILYQLPSGYIKDDFIINGVFKVLKDKEQIEIIEITQISSGNVFIEE